MRTVREEKESDKRESRVSRAKIREEKESGNVREKIEIKVREKVEK